MTIRELDLAGTFQNAYVTRDLDHAVAAVTATHGIADWIFFEPQMDVTTAQGGHGPCHLKVGLGWAGDFQIELIQPLSGNVQHYLDYLPGDPADATPRHHHVCIRVPDWDDICAKAKRLDWPIAQEGGVEGCMFLYVDARASLGHYVEYMWMAPELWAATGGK